LTFNSIEDYYMKHTFDFMGKLCKIDLQALRGFSGFGVKIDARIVESDRLPNISAEAKMTRKLIFHDFLLRRLKRTGFLKLPIRRLQRGNYLFGGKTTR